MVLVPETLEAHAQTAGKNRRTPDPARDEKLVVEALEQQDGLTVAELSNRTGIPDSTLYEVKGRLQNKGKLKMSDNPHLFLTDPYQEEVEIAYDDLDKKSIIPTPERVLELVSERLGAKMKLLGLDPHGTSQSKRMEEGEEKKGGLTFQLKLERGLRTLGLDTEFMKRYYRIRRARKPLPEWWEPSIYGDSGLGS